MNQGSTAHQNKLFDVIKAYEVLGDETARRAYDLSILQSKTASTTQQTKQTAHANTTANYYNPVIIHFSCNQSYFFMGDWIEISWECKNADVIRLIPLGYMDELKGKVIYRVKELEASHLYFELMVTNNHSSQVERRSIRLENGVYKQFTEENIKDQANYSNPHRWALGFLAPLGRSSRKDYGLRVALLGSLFLLAYLNQPNFD